MRLQIACVVFAALVWPAQAQWTPDAADNTPIALAAGDQIQPKVRATTDGGCYVSWFDNRTGGYDVYLQRLDASGTPRWAADGVLIEDRTLSSTQDYGHVVDPDGNAILAFNGTRSGFSQIILQKVAPDGSPLWGASGLNLTNYASSIFLGPPRLCATDDGGSIVCWFESVTNPSGFRIQKLDRDGNRLWTAVASGILELPAAGTWSPADVQPVPGGGCVVLWVRNPTGGVNDAKHLYAQRYSSLGQHEWPAPLIVFDAASVQNGYFPTFLTDGAGVAYFTWYSIGAPRNTYVQAASPDGSTWFPAQGQALGSLPAGRIRVGVAAALDEGGDLYAFSLETDAGTQSSYSIVAQRVSEGGTQWPGAGVELFPTAPQQPANLRAASIGPGAAVFYSDRSGAAMLKGIAIRPDGSFRWSGAPVTACSTLSTKSRLDVAASRSAGMYLLAWSDGRSDSGNVFAQNVNADGTLGPPPPSCDPDFNQDGVADQDDVAYLVDVIAGGENPTGRDPDFDADGVADQDDTAALINKIAGGECP